MLNVTSRLKFYKLRYASHPNEFNEYAVVRWDTDQSLSANSEAISVIRSLEKEKSVETVATQLHLKQGNVLDIARLCLDAGYIESIDNYPIEDTHPKIKPWLTGIDRHWFSWILNKPLLFITYIFIVSGIYLTLSHPHYLPTYNDFFWTNDYFYVLLFSEIIAIAVLLIHEFAHFFVTKAVGGEARMRIDNRYLDLVAETDQYHLALIPKVYRYFVYGAGMYTDLFIIATIMWVYQISQLFNFQLGFIGNLLPVIVLIEIMGIVWQFSAFLETDLYNILCAYWSQDNLYIDTKHFLSLRISHWHNPGIVWLKRFFLRTIFQMKFFSEANDLRYFTHKERRQFLTYGIFYVAGILFNTLLFIFVSIPLTILFLKGGITSLWWAARTLNLIEIVKSLLILFILMYSDMLLLGILIRKLKKHESIV